jgi:putative ABC transport system substrate-binding protein
MILCWRVAAATICAVVLVVGIAVTAEPTRTPARIGVLSPPDPHVSVDAVQRGLRQLGYTDSTHVEFRSADGRDERFPELAADLVKLKVDVILAATPPAIRAAQRATTTIPIVMVLSGDPVASGLVQSLAHPGGNTTGPATLTANLTTKRLEIGKEVVPSVRDLAIIANSRYPGIRESFTESIEVGRRLGVAVHPFDVRESAQLEAVLGRLSAVRPHALIVVPDPITANQMGRIVDFVTKNRLPALDGREQFAERGGLMAYGIDYTDHVRVGLHYIDKILRGAKPSDLPIEQPTKFKLVINQRTARALGLTVPPSLLLRADQVIE